MRNPDRIEPFMELLGKTWKENVPDWRFGQFIVNMLQVLQSNGNDVFYMEEPELLQAIEEYFNSNK